MPRAAFLAGTFGGIIGILMAGIGIVWSIINLLFVIDFFTYIDNVFIWSEIWLGASATFLVPYPLTGGFFLTFSLILVTLLIVSGILLGVGFYGLYQVGRKTMGIVGLIFSSVGSLSGALLILMGNSTYTIEPAPIQINSWYQIITEGGYPIQTMWFTRTPNFFFIWIGLVILSVSFILLGVTSISTSEITTRPTALKSAGILSIVGACFFFPYILTDLISGEKALVTVLGPILALVGFALIFSAFIIWAVVFYSSREI